MYCLFLYRRHRQTPEALSKQSGCPSICVCVRDSLRLWVMTEGVLMTLITINRYQVHWTLMTLTSLLRVCVYKTYFNPCKIANVIYYKFYNNQNRWSVTLSIWYTRPIDTVLFLVTLWGWKLRPMHCSPQDHIAEMRKQGRPRRRWYDDTTDCQYSVVSWMSWAAQDREKWKKQVSPSLAFHLQ